MITIKKLSGGGGGSATWGDISGTLSNQTDLNSALSGKQPTLIDLTNIRTVNGNSLLGNTNLVTNYLYSEVVYVSKNIATSGNGTLGTPFKTIQEGINYFGLPINAADYQRRCKVVILDSGVYTENLIIPHRAITIEGNGVTISGNITREIDDNLEFAVSSSTFRARFSMIGSGVTARDSHTGFINGIRVTGNYSAVIRSGGVGFTTHDTYWQGVRLDGTFTTAVDIGNESTYLIGCRMVGVVSGGTSLYLQRVINTQFDAAVACYFWVNFDTVTFLSTTLSGSSSVVEQGWKDVVFATGTTFTFPAGQTIAVNDETYQNILKNVTFTNVPTYSNLSFDGIVLSKASGKGIKIDPALPTFGWRDIVGQIIPRASGSPAPAFTAFRGTNILEYAFQTGDKIDNISFHMPHDYVVGTDIYLHVHWGHNGTAISGSFVITWYVSYAKGHQQGLFNSELTVIQTISTPNIATVPQWQHRIDEIQLSNTGGDITHIDKALLEPDGIIKVALTTTTISTITGSATSNLPYILFVDVHYQSTNIATKNKIPNFYV